MKKKVLIALIIGVLIIAITGLVYASIVLNNKEKIEDSYFQELSLNELKTKIEKKETFILVISQTTCSHCAEYKPKIKKVLAQNKITGYYIEKDQLSADETTELNNIANITGTPTTIFIVDGEEKSTSTRLNGAQSTNKIKSRLKAMGYIK